MWNPMKPSAWDAAFFELVLVFGGALLLIFDMPQLTRWFCAWCVLMGVLRIVAFLKHRRAGNPTTEK